LFSNVAEAGFSGKHPVATSYCMFVYFHYQPFSYMWLYQFFSHRKQKETYSMTFFYWLDQFSIHSISVFT
jgi:hypothetical protein